MPNYNKLIYTRAEADALLALVYKESIIQVFKVAAEQYKYNYKFAF
jgi:hypothetical protein